MTIRESTATAHRAATVTRVSVGALVSMLLACSGGSSGEPATGGRGSGGLAPGGSAGGTGGAATGGSGATGGVLGTGGGTATGGTTSSGGTSSGGMTATGGVATGGMAEGGHGTGGSVGADGGVDGPRDGGGSACAGLLCEDFESGAIDSDKWTVQAKGGTVAVQSQRVAHGKYAARVHGATGSADDWALLVAKSVPASLKGTSTFGRAYVYLTPEATASIHVQLAFAGRDGTGSATGPAPFTKLRYMEVASYGGRWQQGFDLLDLSPLVEEVSYGNGKFATNTWLCLEWQFEDAPDRVTVWVDGTKAASFDNTNVAYASPGPTPKAGAALWDGKSSGLIGGFETFGFGFHDWHPQKAFDIDYDDLVLDAKRIGCLP